MLHLLLLEWKKLRHYMPAKVLLLLYVILMPGILLIGKKIPGPEEISPLGSSLLSFPDIWPNLAYIGNWLTFFFLGFLSIISIASEHNNRTIRQNIITGLTRTDFFLSKFYGILMISLAATLYYVLVCSIIGIMHTETVYWSVASLHLGLIPRFFLMCVGYMSFGFLLGLLFRRRTGLASIFYLSYIMFIELILRYGIHMQFFKHKSMHFYPANALEDLTPIPFSPLAQNFTKEMSFPLFLTPTEAIITSVIYGSLFLYLAYLRLVRADL